MTLNGIFKKIKDKKVSSTIIAIVVFIAVVHGHDDEHVIIKHVLIKTESKKDR